MAVPYLPTGGLLAKVLARRYEYPLDDVTNLARVAQYIASSHEPAFVKRRVCAYLERKQRVAERKLGGGLPANHLRLARLGLPIYVTTNYDDYLERAVASITGVQPLVEICRWHDQFESEPGRPARREQSAATPRIFHLHGHLRTPSSLLLTEDDYVDFTVSLAQRNNQKNPMVPLYVRRALANTNLLFIGYSLEDWNFRVLMRHLMKQQKIQPHNARNSISIQLANNRMPPDRRRRAEKFLEVYLKTSSSVDVHWGDAGPFLAELLRRVERSPKPRVAS
ncbi:hypothetical protein BU204_23490 [Actinophytocola xanthii]|uniref:Uncharacterized protein n=1 Tax=Actinophytocola xanthii TaxID=1912961 RepID=A0A1Q8CL18_9PSEU|nr:hypothetical protein BU204_23490 [Actinophytocola xanthii]